jgi:hypothetical protein
MRTEPYSKSRFVRVDKRCSITEAGAGWACKNARFVFDKQISVGKDDVLELLNGQFFLISNGTRTTLEGKWDRRE